MTDSSKPAPWFAHGKQLLKGTVFACEVVAEFETGDDAVAAAVAYNAVDTKIQGYVLGKYVKTIGELKAERDSLRAAIVHHRAQKADDRCIDDDDRLYAVLGDGVKCDRRVGDTSAMLANCARFIKQRCEPGGWPSYVELEVKISAILAIAQELAAKCLRGSRACSACGAIAYMGAVVHNPGCAITRLGEFR